MDGLASPATPAPPTAGASAANPAAFPPAPAASPLAPATGTSSQARGMAAGVSIDAPARASREIPTTSPASTSSRETPSTAAASSRPSTETPADSSTSAASSRPSTETLADFSTSAASSRPSAETPADSSTSAASSRPSTETPARAAPQGFNWALQVTQAGIRIEQCGAYLGGWEAYLRGRGEFLCQLAGFAPEGRFPAAVVWMAGACNAIGQALGHFADMIKGASELCALVGGAIQRFVEQNVPEMGAEPQGDVENPSSAPRLVIVSSVEELEEVLVIWKATGIAFAIDVDPQTHCSIGFDCYKHLHEEGQQALELIRTARHIKLKRAEYMQAQQSPPAPGT
ncbi:hypothetical protein ACQJBY_042072 [Aegilops geniculata]